MNQETQTSGPTETHVLKRNGEFPNSALPLIVYRQQGPKDPDSIERLFADHGWTPKWRDRDGLLKLHHFHRNMHEAIGIARGDVTGQFGGPEGPVITLHAGDVVVIPAGVVHVGVGSSRDLLMVGAYPEGCPLPDVDIPKPENVEGHLAEIAGVPIPPIDPVHGNAGPVRTIWPGSPLEHP